MATAIRNPLATRPHGQQPGINVPLLHAPSRRQSLPKRSRSPDPSVENNPTQSSKRLRATPPVPASERKKEKERARAEYEEGWRTKYTRAFPHFVFHFDIDPVNSDIAAWKTLLEKRVISMQARVDDFFSRDVTHLITLRVEDPTKDNKENNPRTSALIDPAALLGSPVRLKGRIANELPCGASNDLVQKALAWGIKVWSATKLENVLDRCHAPHPRNGLAISAAGQSAVAASKERSLTRLLESERLHGTSERDPTQKRHDFVYFSKNSYFVLVEDLRQELATVAAQEYPIERGPDGTERGGWPVLHCHPRARGPFIEYDEREEKKRQKADRAEHDREKERAKRKAQLKEELERKRKAQIALQAKQHDLRRTVSLNNLYRRASYPQTGDGGLVDLDADFGDEERVESANASGYLASGTYMAASGNSVGVTSTTGTTSTAGVPFRSLQMPHMLKGRLQQQVVTSRKVAPLPQDKDGNKENVMGPPLLVPSRQRVLRKSRSTNTMRLPKREEGAKPGYCESCRVKFEDFTEHIEGRRHKKFASDDRNFDALDQVLDRVRRRTKVEVEEENREWLSGAYCSSPIQQPASDDEQMMPTPTQDAMFGDDVQWDEWVEDNAGM
ncbi:hypothetical protein OBBRIDRAFT_772163 [Obba rivulosa]|uniref:DBF4-type domain-containing protein n=1 Tax=Obba rivulosa TaxID=1052685 RepID=A0A8E2DN43_9APHY|nr:hypothetical protein OBBRIDRAFT_772163 [Obba rivulosa]